MRVAVLVPVLWGVGVHAAESARAVPAGSIDFAGRLARQHWHLFGPEIRPAIEAANRELREASQLLDATSSPELRSTELDRARATAERIRQWVTQHPDLVRIDLTSARPVVLPHAPITLPGETGALLLEVDQGGAGHQFAVATRDLSELPRGNAASLVIVELGATGKTYALITLEDLPVGRTTLSLELRRPGQGAARLPLDVIAPPRGRLKLTILSDDDGQPVPAMVRLTWSTDGRARPPSNAIDFAPQFDRNGKFTAERVAYLPGTRQGSFWCAPEPFDMTLSPGEWEIAVGRGFEHTPVFEKVTIRPGEIVEKIIRPRRWVTMRERGWWSGDDHVHARLTSDGDARNLLAWARAEDVHVTNLLEMGDIFRTYFEQRGFGPSNRVQDGDHVLVPAQECPRTREMGHVLTMNTSGVVRDTRHYYLYDPVLDGVHAQGGLTGYAHAATGMFEVHRDMTLNVPRGKVDFFEIHQFNNLGTDLYYEFLNLGCKVTASAGSDLPWGGTIGETRVYGYLGRDRFSADGWFEAVQRGRTFTTSGPMIEFNVDDALPGDELRVATGRTLRIRARAWSDAALRESVRLEIVRHGEVIRATESKPDGASEAALDFTIDAADGFWIAARARTGTGTSAHTTPVYVVREALRFWKFEAVDELIGKRHASLAQIEEAVAAATRADLTGRPTGDPSRQQLAADGPALLERVAAARELYAGLRRIAVDERSRRSTINAAPQPRSDPPGWILLLEQNFPVAGEFPRWRLEGSADLEVTMERTLSVRTKRGHVGGAATNESTVWFDQPASGDLRVEFDASAAAGNAAQFLFGARTIEGRQSIFDWGRPLARAGDYAGDERLELYALDILRTDEKTVALRRLGGRESAGVFKRLHALAAGDPQRQTLRERFDQLTILQRVPSPFVHPERVHHFDLRVVGARITVLVDGAVLFDVTDAAGGDRPVGEGYFGFRNTQPTNLAFDSVRVYRRATGGEQ